MRRRRTGGGGREGEGRRREEEEIKQTHLEGWENIYKKRNWNLVRWEQDLSKSKQSNLGNMAQIDIRSKKWQLRNFRLKKRRHVDFMFVSIEGADI